MKGVICYFSGSGNTKLACEYIARHITNAEFELVDIKKNDKIDINKYDIIGFATFADYSGPSQYVRDFIGKLPKQSGKPAFVFNTFGSFNGATLRILASLVGEVGFDVVEGHALHMPENIATMITMGFANTQAPNKKEFAAFNKFIDNLNNIIIDIKNNCNKKHYKSAFMDKLIPQFSRTYGRKAMGIKMIDEELCTKCGLCASVCPYGAIEIQNIPAFNQDKCYGCFACYNHCPQHAIYTKKYRGVGHYPEPISEVKEKLKA